MLWLVDFETMTDASRLMLATVGLGVSDFVYRIFA